MNHTIFPNANDYAGSSSSSYVNSYLNNDVLVGIIDSTINYMVAGLLLLLVPATADLKAKGQLIRF